MFDTDNNGSIDSYEFVCALSLMSHATLAEKAELIFNLYDFDRSQTITKDELTVLMTNTLCALKCMEGKPAPTISEIEQKTNELFSEMDDDRNNLITLREFKSYIKRDKQILEILLSFGIAKKEDLGTDFGSGNGQAPDIDEDLESECNPKGLQQTDRKNAVKDGLDFKEKGEFEEEDLGQGDQSMSNATNGTILNMVPDSYKPSKRDSEAPDAQLDLDYIYGIRCHDARNNLRYNFEGKLAYHCAGVGVIMDKKTNTQQHFMGHRDDIHCLAIDPTGVFCATGEIGPNPRLFVWNSKTMEEVYHATAPLTKGIKHVAFSKDGKYLACSDMSDDHNIAIFDCKVKLKAGQSWTPIAEGRGSRAVIMSLGWNQTSDIVIATCVKQVVFFTFANGKIQSKNGTGWGSTPADTVLCQATAGTTLFTGHLSGEIISWSGSSVSKRQKCHTQKVNCLYTDEDGKVLISGSNDGIVSTWSVQGSALTLIKNFDMKQPGLMSMMPGATSVCQSKQKDTLLVATRGGEIFEFHQETGKATVLLRGHFDSELWGLATHPSQPEIYTWGRDAMLAVWDLKTRRQKKHCKLESGGDAIAFSNQGNYLVLGFINGTMLVLDQNFGAITKRRDRAGKAIQCIKFSPNDEICAAGGHDQLVMTYDVKNKFKPLKKCRGCDTTIWQMDFSLDSQYLIIDRLLFFDMQTGKNVPRGASMLKNEPWATWTLRSGWPVLGIYPACAMTDDINAVDRSPDGKVIATADDFGLVKLFKYPCPVPKSSFNNYTGHSSHVTNVMFTKNKVGDKYLITTGGEDKCIFQWKYLMDKNAIQQSGQQEQEENDDQDEEFEDIADGFAAKKEPEEEKQLPKSEFEEEEIGDGDQALAVKPFLGQVKAMTPTGYKAPKNAGQAPDNNLKLKWAHGFRSFDTRGNLKYTSQGHVVFTTAGVGVVQDLQKMKQEFFNLHKEDIVSMALHPDGDIVATGQMAGKELNESTVVKQTLDQAKGAAAKQAANDGKHLKGSEGKLVVIYIWKASTREVLAKIFGFHRRAIKNLKFSPSGKKLLSIGQDDQNSFAVYDWASGTKLCQGATDQAGCYDANWGSDENSFATCGAKHLKLYSQNGQNVKVSKCQYQDKLPKGEQITTVNYILNNVCVSGTSSGQLIPWNGGTMGKAVKAHASAIWCIEKPKTNSTTAFYTGGNDGKVIIWNPQYQATKTFDIKSLVTWQGEAGLRSLDIKSDGTMLIGTRGSDVLEVSNQGALVRKVVQGHFKGVQDLPEIWGCTTHPNEQIFASAGADKCVRTWTENKMIAVSQQLSSDPTALDWSRCGKFIAVGDRNGDCTILSSKTLEVLGSMKSSLSGKKAVWVEDIKFSPDSTQVAFGTHGGCSKIDFVTINSSGKPTKIESTKQSLTSALLSVDWSQDGNSVVAVSQSYELIFFDTNSKKMQNASSHKETQWQTWTAKFGFPVQGIWPGIDYSDVNTVDRSKNGQIIATGDDFGLVKIFKYPCVIEKAQNHEYCGHSSHVTKVKFSSNDRFVVSTGGNDMTVMIWETDIGGSQVNQEDIEQQEQIEEPEDPEYDDNNPDDPSREVKQNLAKIQRDKIKQQKQKELQDNQANKQIGGEFDEQDLGQGDEFLAVLPWKGQMKPPESFKRAQKNQNLPPLVELQLEWVHGYKGDCTKNNLRYLQDGTLAYYIAGLCVIYNIETHTQKHFQLHNDDVTAIAFHPDGKIIASGENGKKPSAFIWDSTTCKKIFELKGHGIQQTIIAMAFSTTGKHLVLVCGSDDHDVAVYNSQTGACVAESKGCKELVTEVAWENDETFVMVGPKLYFQFTLSASSFIKKRGNFGGNDQRIASAAFNGSTCLTGNIKGELYLWNSATISGQPKKLHQRMIDAISVTAQHIFTGARDSKITVMNKQNYSVLFTIDTDLIKDSNSAQIRAITLNSRSDRLMIGTFGHEIIELPINLKNNSCDIAQNKILINGHFAPMTTYTNEAWGLAIFPNQEKYVTCSDDAKMKVWDTATRKLIKTIPLNLDKTGQIIPLDPIWKDLAPAAQGRSVDISPKGDFIAVGMRDGALRIFQTSTWKMVHMQKCGNEWIEDLKFSPDGKYLVVGSHDNKLYAFSMPDCKLLKKFGVSSSFITHIDWSLDSQNIRTNDGSYELLYYNIESYQQIKGGATQFRNETWATQSCVLGWAVQGIWQSGQDGSDINHCDRSHKPIIDQMQLLATGDDTGKVNLFRYPSTTEKSQPLQGKGHSSHVTKVRFSPKDNYLFSTGGNDTAVIQWKIVVPQ